MGLPSFLIIGAQKSGTSSLFHYLSRHPDVYMSPVKELHYFDREQGYPDDDWYLSCFQHNRVAKVAGEATPIYCYWPDAIARISEFDSQVKLIMIMRNPIDRAVSQYWMEFDRNDETLSLEKALVNEEVRLASSDTFSLRHHSYLSRGRYCEQLKRVFQYFAPQQVLLLRTEDLAQSPENTMRRLTGFIGVEPLGSDAYSERYFVGNYPPITEDLRERLRHYFAPYNRRLTSEYGIRTDDWD